ncbi:MAG: MFS transporter, partial [Planctomycetota bacterium]
PRPQALADRPERRTLWPAFSGYDAGILAFVNAVYCLTLPHTPPQREAAGKFALGKVLAMLKDPSFAVLSALGLVMMIFASFYYFKTSNFIPTVHIPKAWVAPGESDRIPEAWISTVMSVGQVMEILTMFLLPWFYRRFGSKITIAAGLVAWLTRFVIFATSTDLVLVVAAQALHGFCFAFALAATMIYVERICTTDVRGSMQSFLGWLMGLGTLAGAWLSSAVHDAYTAGTGANAVTDWGRVWLVPAAGIALVLVVFILAFRARDTEEGRGVRG